VPVQSFGSKPEPEPNRVPFLIHPSWSARRIADEAREFSKNVWRDAPIVLQLQEMLMEYNLSGEEIWKLMTPEERSGVKDFPLIAIPTHDFDVWIAAAPSGADKFIVFDFDILLELSELFAAIPNQTSAAWAACILRGALRHTTARRMTGLAAWVRKPQRELIELQERGATEVPYNSSMLFGVSFCVNFLLAHEWAHHALGHFDEKPLVAEGEMAAQLAPHHGNTSPDMEFAADGWAMNITSRLPAFEFSSRLLAIELMFWYLHLIEVFQTKLRNFEGIAHPPEQHPPVIQRAERISRIGENVFETERDDTGNLPTRLSNNLKDRQMLWNLVRNLWLYMRQLAETYSTAPEETLAIHEAVRAGDLDQAAYPAEMSALAEKSGLTSRGGIAKRIYRHWKSKLF
jgi:hypothetical protein